jgi:hypothetical protein
LSIYGSEWVQRAAFNVVIDQVCSQLDCRQCLGVSGVVAALYPPDRVLCPLEAPVVHGTDWPRGRWSVNVDPVARGIVDTPGSKHLLTPHAVSVREPCLCVVNGGDYLYFAKETQGIRNWREERSNSSTLSGIRVAKKSQDASFNKKIKVYIITNRSIWAPHVIVRGIPRHGSGSVCQCKTMAKYAALEVVCIHGDVSIVSHCNHKPCNPA